MLVVQGYTKSYRALSHTGAITLVSLSMCWEYVVNDGLFLRCESGARTPVTGGNMCQTDTIGGQPAGDEVKTIKVSI